VRWSVLLGDSNNGSLNTASKGKLSSTKLSAAGSWHLRGPDLSDDQAKRIAGLEIVRARRAHF